MCVYVSTLGNKNSTLLTSDYEVTYLRLYLCIITHFPPI